MKLKPALEQQVRDQCRTHCPNPHCQDDALELRALLLHTLAHHQVQGFSPAGHYRLNPTSVHVRPVYEIAHVNGRTLRIAFTGLSNIQTFSKRGRSTHCYPDEFAHRLKDFLNSSPPPNQQHSQAGHSGPTRRPSPPPTKTKRPPRPRLTHRPAPWQKPNPNRRPRPNDH